MHKIVTGRSADFASLRQEDGLSGYPSRAESPHDFVENSHASTILSYAHGLAVARDAGADKRRHIVAVVGDGSLTGGMAYEALNNIGHGAGQQVIIVLNDNGRSYAPTVLEPRLRPRPTSSPERRARPGLPERITEKLSHGLTEHPPQPDVRAAPAARIEHFLRELPLVGPQAEQGMDAFKAAVREFLQPPSFFEALGARYTGPIDWPRHRGPRARAAERRRAVERRADRRPRADPEGPGLPAGRGRRREAPPRRPDLRSGHRAPRRRCSPATPRRSPRRSSRRPSTTRGSSRSPRR